MASYEYANARIRALRTKLLGRQHLMRLVTAASIEDLIGELGQTDYAPEIDEALTRRTGVGVVFEACRWHLERRLRLVRSYFGEDGRQALFLLASIRDRDNVLAIVRGLAAHAAPSEIFETLEASGNLELDKYRMISQAIRLREALIQAQWLAPAYRPWLRTGQEALDEDTDPQFLQDLLSDAFGLWLRRQMDELKDQERTLAQEWLAIQADFENVLMALRLRYRIKAELKPRRNPVYAVYGRIMKDDLIRIAHAASDAEALTLVRGSARGEVFSQEDRLDLDALYRTAYRARLQSGLAFFQRDPISIAPGIAYFEAKRAEAALLRYAAAVIVAGADRALLQRRMSEEALWDDL